MEPIRPTNCGCHTDTLNRRTLIAGAVATGAVVAGQKSTLAQGSPVASPATGIDADRLMALSIDLCGGAELDENGAEGLLLLLDSEPDIVPAFEELEAVSEITPESIGATSAEAQRLSTNILQYWFIGQYDGEPVENRADLFFSLACWQPLPYATQASSCKSFGYWAVEIEL